MCIAADPQKFAGWHTALELRANLELVESGDGATGGAPAADGPEGNSIESFEHAPLA